MIVLILWLLLGSVGADEFTMDLRAMFNSQEITIPAEMEEMRDELLRRLRRYFTTGYFTRSHHINIRDAFQKMLPNEDWKKMYSELPPNSEIEMDMTDMTEKIPPASDDLGGFFRHQDEPMTMPYSIDDEVQPIETLHLSSTREATATESPRIVSSTKANLFKMLSTPNVIPNIFNVTQPMKAIKERKADNVDNMEAGDSVLNYIKSMNARQKGDAFDVYFKSILPTEVAQTTREPVYGYGEYGYGRRFAKGQIPEVLPFLIPETTQNLITRTKDQEQPIIVTEPGDEELHLQMTNTHKVNDNVIYVYEHNTKPKSVTVYETTPKPEIVYETTPVAEIVNMATPNPIIVYDPTPKPAIVDDATPKPAIVYDDPPKPAIDENAPPTKSVIYDEATPERAVYEDEVEEIALPTDGLRQLGKRTRGRKRKKKTTKTTPSVKFDLSALMDIIENLTQGWSGDLIGMLNKSLNEQSIPTCFETGGPATDYPDEYSHLNGILMGKCFVCGMEDEQMPYNTHCADAFAADVIPLGKVDSTARGKLTSYRKYCRWKNVPGYRSNKVDPRTMWGRWTGGCSVRWVDITGMYTQRTCRNRLMPTMGKHWASKRMAKLELALKHMNDGCIISPVASLVPLSRAISLYARFHACVCSGSWCNHASVYQQWSASIAMLTMTTTVVLLKCLTIHLKTGLIFIV